MEIKYKQKFKARTDISKILGGDPQKGISISSKTNAIMLFMNEERLYSDYFYPKRKYDYCMYTGIGRIGHQDSIENKTYNLNMEVLTHKKNEKAILIFDRIKGEWIFVGRYELIETHQNVQPDDNGDLRRVFCISS